MKEDRLVDQEFERLYETYHQSLFQFLFYMVRNRQIAEELVQEVYIKVFHSYSSFKGDSSEKTWLYSVARHVGVDWIRSQNRKKRKLLGLIDISDIEIQSEERLPDEIILEKEEVQEVFQMLGKCSLDQQHVIILRYIETLTVSETANILGWSESKVKTTQHRAIKALKRLMGKLEGDLKVVGR